MRAIFRITIAGDPSPDLDHRAEQRGNNRYMRENPYAQRCSIA
jgi:hypothetical protein